MLSSVLWWCASPVLGKATSVIYSAELKTSRAGFVRQIDLVVKELGRT